MRRAKEKNRHETTVCHENGDDGQPRRIQRHALGCRHKHLSSAEALFARKAAEVGSGDGLMLIDREQKRSFVRSAPPTRRRRPLGSDGSQNSFIAEVTPTIRARRMVIRTLLDCCARQGFGRRDGCAADDSAGDRTGAGQRRISFGHMAAAYSKKSDALRWRLVPVNSIRRSAVVSPFTSACTKVFPSLFSYQVTLFATTPLF